MPLGPRFRPGAVRRPFVDREEILTIFNTALGTAAGQPQVMVLTGIGGIGKSRLLTELRGRVEEEHPTALLDLQVPASRQPEHALAILRSQLGRKKIKFHRFDIAYAVLWQRLNPHLPISRLAFAEHSEILTEVLNDASGVPVFGTAAKLIEAGATKYRRRQWIRRDETLQVLDELTLEELFNAVGYLFSTDLREAVAGSAPYVVFVDAYEALSGGAGRGGSLAGADGWLRDLVGQLDSGLVVMAGREPPGWPQHDPEWAVRLHPVAVDDLPMGARHELLTASGVTDLGERRVIAASSAGVPFYLHLAVDAQTDGARLRHAVAPEALLERFLKHVEPYEVRLLELLSTPRVFDFETFATVAEAFDLPGHQLAWESLTGYSFVQSAGDGVRLHQLMVQALRHRLTPAVTTTLHRIMRTLWDERAERGSERGASRVVALREAAWHRLHDDDLAAADLLDYVDRITTFGGKQGIDGVLADLREYLGAAPEDARTGAIVELVRYLEVEEALLRGDPERAEALTGPPPADLSAPVPARLAVAAANARRMLGRTESALSICREVWERGGGAARLQAGLWAADLDMCQGRFADAAVLAGELLDSCADDDHEFRGDVSRLLSLSYRFAFDFTESARHLDAAENHYRLADSVVGIANVRTNRAELLALLDPGAAIPAAGAAIEAQHELGALHECGKAYTALGIAHLMLDDLERADHALDTAVDVLDRAGYRSGRARAELFRAAAHARRGRLDDAGRSARWAVAELETVAVYPTLVVTAERLLELVGAPDPTVRAAASRAREKIQLPTTRRPPSIGMDAVLGRLVGVDATELHDQARATMARSAGYYNYNVRAETDFGPMNVRIPAPGADVMDLRIWPEFEVLRALTPFVSAAPRLRWHSTEPVFQLHDFVTGPILDAVAPRGKPVPDGLIGDVVNLFVELGRVPAKDLPLLPSGWPSDGDSSGFASRLSDITEAVYCDHRESFARLFRDLGFPKDPLAAAVAGWPSLSERPFRLIHADVHRKNMIVTERGVVFIDWELALFGDPVYDLAAHVHKMVYRPDELSRLLTGWAAAEPAAADGWRADLDTYLRHERVKSAVVDSLRYAKQIRQGCPADQASALLSKLVTKLRAARAIWQLEPEVDPDEVLSALRGS